MNHDQAVMKHYLVAENVVDNDDALYDMALKEYDYFEADESPFGDHPYEKGRQLGDIDIGLVDLENNILYAKEVKTGDPYKSIGKAQDQLDRIENHFEPFGWTVIKQVVLE